MITDLIFNQTQLVRLIRLFKTKSFDKINICQIVPSMHSYLHLMVMRTKALMNQLLMLTFSLFFPHNPNTELFFSSFSLHFYYTILNFKVDFEIFMFSVLRSYKKCKQRARSICSVFSLQKGRLEAEKLAECHSGQLSSNQYSVESKQSNVWRPLIKNLGPPWDVTRVQVLSSLSGGPTLEYLVDQKSPVQNSAKNVTNRSESSFDQTRGKPVRT